MLLTISAFGVISQTQEKAKRSSPPRNEHKLELNKPKNKKCMMNKMKIKLNVDCT